MAKKLTQKEEDAIDFIKDMIADEIESTDHDSITTGYQQAYNAYLAAQEKIENDYNSSDYISTDIADAIEWIVPEVMKAIAPGSPVASFDAVSNGDKAQALIESTVVHDAIMKDCNGFMVLQEFVRDALMLKNGFLKAYVSHEVSVDKQYFNGLTQPELNAMQSEPNVTVSDIEELKLEASDGSGDSVSVFNCVASIRTPYKKANIECVAPENIRISAMHNSPSLETARFVAHIDYRKVHELVQMGYDADLFEDISEDNANNSAQEYGDNFRFNVSGESTYNPDISSGQPMLKEVQLTECYMYADYKGKGDVEYVKVLLAGDPEDTKSIILDIEPIDSCPIISATAILLPHKVFGLSIYDRLLQIQKEATQLTRSIINNARLQNNQRTIAVENMVNLDDLLVSRPGGVIRAKNLNAVAPFPTPELPKSTFDVLSMLEAQRSGKVGVSPEGSVNDQIMNSQVGSEGLARVMNQKEELVGLMVRNFVELAVIPLYFKMRNMLMIIGNQTDHYVNGKWSNIDPTSWNSRTRAKSNVGTGTGNRAEKINAMMVAAQWAEKIATGGQPISQKMYNIISDSMALVGISNASDYFDDPSAQDTPENQVAKLTQALSMQEQKHQQDLAHIQQLSEDKLIIATSQYAAKNSQLEGDKVGLRMRAEQAELGLEKEKVENDQEIAMLKQEVSEAQLMFKNRELDQKDREIDIQEAVAIHNAAKGANNGQA